MKLLKAIGIGLAVTTGFSLVSIGILYGIHFLMDSFGPLAWLGLVFVMVVALMSLFADVRRHMKKLALAVGVILLILFALGTWLLSLEALCFLVGKDLATLIWVGISFSGAILCVVYDELKRCRII